MLTNESRAGHPIQQSSMPFGLSVYQSTYMNLFPTAYNPYRMPASLKLAEDHAAATRFGQIVESEGYQPLAYCQCCRNLIDTDPFTWRSGIEAIGKTTSEYAMLFYFIIFGFLWLLFLFLLVGINSLVNVEAIRKTFISALNVQVYSSSELTSEYHANRVARGITGIVAVVCFAVARRVFMAFIKRKNSEFEAARVTPSVFTVRLKLPAKKMRSDADITADLRNITANQSLNVVNVNRVYEIREYSKLLLKLMETQKTLRMNFIKQGENFKNREKLEIKNQDYLRRFRFIKNEFSRDSGIANKFTGYAFVTFSTPQERALVEQTFAKKWGFRRTQLIGYQCTPAPEPKNVIWENYGLTKTSKTLRRLTTYIFAFLIICLNFGIILGIRVGQYSTISGVNSISQLWINFLISIIIAYFNIAILMVLQYITKFEQRTTFSSDQSNKIVKVSIAMFINQAIVILITSLLATVIQNDDKGYRVSIWRLWTGTGVMNSMVLVFLINIGFHLIDPLLNFYRLIRLVNKFFLRRKVIKDPQGNKVTQAELNKSYEYFQFDLINAYCCYFRNFATAMFYAVVLPYGLLLTMVIMFVQFGISYFEIIYFRGKEQDFAFDFTEKMGYILSFCGMMFAVGFIVFEAIAGGDVTSYAWAILGIACVDCLLDFLYLYAKPWRGKFFGSDVNYENYQFSFPENYDRLNPITQVQAFSCWIREMDLRSKIPGAAQATPSQIAGVFRSQFMAGSKLLPPGVPGPLGSQRSDFQIPGSFGELGYPQALPGDIMKSMINYTLHRKNFGNFSNFGRVSRAELQPPIVEDIDMEQSDAYQEFQDIDLYKTQHFVLQATNRRSNADGRAVGAIFSTILHPENLQPLRPDTFQAPYSSQYNPSDIHVYQPPDNVQVPYSSQYNPSEIQPFKPLIQLPPTSEVFQNSQQLIFTNPEMSHNGIFHSSAPQIVNSPFVNPPSQSPNRINHPELFSAYTPPKTTIQPPIPTPIQSESALPGIFLHPPSIQEIQSNPQPDFFASAQNFSLKTVENQFDPRNQSSSYYPNSQEFKTFGKK